jgi:4-hydroxybenzoate polyprenyltransferase
LFKQIFDFFVFTSLFIACCAVLMVYQTGLLFHVRFPFALYAFVFSGSVCSYNFHWYLTPPDVPKDSYKQKWNVNNRPLHLVLFVLGLIGAAITSFLLLKHWMWLGVTAFLTFLYSAPKIEHPLAFQLRRIAVGKTIFLAASWAHITSLLPLLIAQGMATFPQVLFVANRFFFIYAICIVFDRRDVEDDRKAGIKSLITYFDSKGIDRLFWISMFLTLATALFLQKWLSWGDIAVLLIPALIMSLLYEKSKQTSSDYLYYFLLDGLMALSAPILILLRFAR